MSEVIISVGLLILYVSYVQLIQDKKIMNNEQRMYELEKQLRELKEDIYINK